MRAEQLSESALEAEKNWTPAMFSTIMFLQALGSGALFEGSFLP